MPIKRYDYRLLFPLGIVVIIAVVFAYSPAISGPWLLDDSANLLQNRAIQEFQPAHFDDFRDVAVSGQAGPLGRPLAMLSFVSQRDESGVLDSGRVKAVNLLLHLLVASLLGYLALKIFMVWGFAAPHARAAALVTAALWCAAPLQLSTVMYAVQRMSQLSTFWVLAGLAIYTHYRGMWLYSRPRVQHVVALFLWLALCFCLGVYSKENAAVLLPLLLLLETCVFAWVVAGSKVRFLELVSWSLLALYLLVPVFLYFLEPAWLTRSYASRDFDLHERVSVQLPLLWKYLQWSLVPDIRSLVFFQDGHLAAAREGTQSVLLPSLAWLLAIVVALVLRCKALIFALCFFLIGHSLESSVFALEVAYEHRNYLPSAGLFIGVVALLCELTIRYRREKLVTVIVGLLFCVSLSMLFLRAQIWTSAESIYQYANQNAPESARAEFLYAAALLDGSAVTQSGADGQILRQARLLEARRRLRVLALELEPDIAALVMLIRIDSTILPEFFGSEAWESRLLQSLSSRPLQAQDYVAISYLTDCLVGETCLMSPEGRETFVAVLEGLPERPVLVGAMRAKLGSLDDRATLASLQVYERLAEQVPENPVPHARLIEIYSEMGQRGKVLQSMRDLMRADTHRRFLAPMVQALE